MNIFDVEPIVYKSLNAHANYFTKTKWAWIGDGAQIHIIVF